MANSSFKPNVCEFPSHIALAPFLPLYILPHNTTTGNTSTALDNSPRQLGMYSKTAGDTFSTSEYADLYLEVIDGGCGAPKRVVVKQVRVAQDQDTGSHRELTFLRLSQYIKRAQLLNHPRIGKPLGLCRNYGLVAALVLLFFPNGNVLCYLKEHAAPTDEIRLRLTIDLLQGVAYLHGQGITHDNIRAENVLIDSSGMAVLSDTQYNSIVNIDSAAPYSFIDSRSRWTSPEALIGDPVSETCARASKEADIYSAAMTIAQSSFLADHDLPSVKFWTLQLPFAHIRSPITVTAMLMKVTNDEITSADLRDKVPYIIWTALKDCLRRILEDELRAMDRS
ncbi:hypothetical protein HWV62_35742 [Athelia sp. TMB]|nr:hypothetical protein HWV62_35742 [Athelia sp. TMB]